MSDCTISIVRPEMIESIPGSKPQMCFEPQRNPYRNVWGDYDMNIVPVPCLHDTNQIDELLDYTESAFDLTLKSRTQFYEFLKYNGEAYKLYGMKSSKNEIFDENQPDDSINYN